jgi:hypothetical protein
VPGLFRPEIAALVASCALGLGAVGSAERASAGGNPCGPNHFVRAQHAHEPVTAWFARRSYAPGSSATLWVRARPSRAIVRVYHAVEAHWWAEITPAANVALRGKQQRLTIRIGNWPSGLYFADVAVGAAGGSAPFIVRPRHAGENRVAVVLPTNTWAAYNLRDGDGNGYGDTWYADPRVHTVVLARPFLNGGFPRHLEGFSAWLADKGRRADFYSDEDLNAITSGGRLASLYDLVVFAGHEEYVTEHEFAVVERYRNLGGNLAFLSANNFFARVRLHAGRMTCLAHFRKLGRPEAGLVGVQYIGWFDRRFRSRPYVVRNVAAAPWLFEGTGLRAGDTFGFSYGIEIDAMA